MAWSNPLYRDDNPLGKFVTVCLVLTLAFIGFVISTISNNRREAAQENFPKGEFIVVSLYENEPETARLIVEKCRPHVQNTKPVAVLQEKDGQREMYRVPEGVKIAGLTTPKYLQLNPAIIPGMAPSWSLVYQIFKGPDATPKIRQWAKANGYSNADFELKWGNLKEYDTDPLVLTAKKSSVSPVGFFKSGVRLYLWDGQHVNDVSKGITSNIQSAQGREVNYYDKEYVPWLLTIAE